MREDLSGLSQQPSGPRPKQPAEPLDLVQMAEDLKGAHPATAAAPALSPTARMPVGAPSRFPDIQPRYDRFGEPTNEAAWDIETAKGGGFAPSFGGGPPLRSFRTALLGEAVTGGRMILGIPGLLEKGVEAAGAPFTGPAYQRQQAAERAAGAPPETPPGIQFARALDPRAMIDAAMRGDEQAIMQLLSMPAIGAVGGEALRGRPGAGVVRGAAVAPGAAEAFATLGLDPATATAADVDAAFRDVAKRTHPDVSADARAQRGGPTDPIAAAQQFVRARAAWKAAQDILRGKLAGGFQAPAAEETQFRAQQARRGPPPAPAAAEPVVTPPPGRGADVLRTMSDEQLAAQHPLGAQPPIAESGMRPGLQEQQAAFAAERGVERERRAAQIPVEQERRAAAPAPTAVAAGAPPAVPAGEIARPGALQGVAHPALAPEARIAYEAPAGDPLKAQKESLAGRIAGDGPSFAPIARMRQAGATDQQIAAHIASKGVRNAPDWVTLARTMFRIPQPGGEPFREMPSERAAVAPEAGAPHDQAAIQEGLPGIGERKLAGKEQAELMPETAGQPTAKLKAEKIAPEEIGRVKRGGAEPAGEKPMELEAATPRARTKKPLTPDEQLAQHAKLSAQIARDEQVAGAGTTQKAFTDVNAHIGQPGQKFLRTSKTGPGYAAAGRLAQARKRLAALEKTMTPEDLQRARTAAEPIAAARGEEASELGMKTRAGIEREGIEGEPEPDYERLARMSSSKLGPKLRDQTIERMIDYGETREELEKLPDRELINKALDSGQVSESEQTKLLDVLFGMESTGAVRLPKKTLPVPLERRRGMVDAFLKLYSPQSRGPEVAQAAQSFLREYGDMVRRNDVTNARLKKYRGKVDLSQASGVEFMDRAERGLGQVSPGLQAVAEILRQEYDLRRDLVQEAQPGALENWIENYMGRIFQHGRRAPTELQDAARMMAARRPLAGAKGFLKPRTFDYYVDGVAAGKVPVTFDGIDMAKLKLREHDRFIMATRWRRDLTARNLRAFYKSDDLAPDGWVKEPEGEVWYRNERGERVRSGSYYVPEPIAQLEHNVLGPGIGGPAAGVLNAWRTLNNSLTSAILGWSGFHGYMSTMTSAFSRAAVGWNKVAGGDPLGVGDILAGQTVVPAVTRNLLHGAALRAAWKNPTVVNPAMQQLAQLLAHAGGGFEMPREYQAATVAGIKEAIAQGKWPTMIGRAAALAFRAGSIPILEHYVPVIKYGAWADGARAWLAEHPTATDDETDTALQELRYQIDNRFGQVRYDTRFWNQTLKQILQATFFAPGWVMGSVEMVTNAMRDAAGGRFRSPAVMGLLAMVTAMATINALYQLAATGEGPQSLQDVIEPRDGSSDEYGNPNRVSPASYFKVYAAWFRGAKHLLKGERGGGLGPVPSGLVPAFNLVHELWTNRDYSGNMIRNPADPAGKQFQQAARYVVGDWEPLSARNIRAASERGETGFRKYQPVAGITPASREAVRTDAQNMMMRMLGERASARTPEEQERVGARRAIRAGGEGAPGVLTPEQETRARRESFLSPDQRMVGMFRKLSPDQRQQVYGVANEHERVLFGPYVARRMKPYRR